MGEHGSGTVTSAGTEQEDEPAHMSFEHNRLFDGSRLCSSVVDLSSEGALDGACRLLAIPSRSC